MFVFSRCNFVEATALPTAATVHELPLGRPA